MLESPGLIVGGLVVGSFVVVALLIVACVAWLQRRSRSLKESLSIELASSGETIRRGPESALYRGGTAGFSKIKGNGVLVLTDRRLLCQKLVGGRVEVPLVAIAGVREATWFLRSATGGHQHLVVQLHDGSEVGFFVSDHPAWIAALRGQTG
jgi:hypothetical protein